MVFVLTTDRQGLWSDAFLILDVLHILDRCL
jgi:hypothetical protein